MSRVLIHVGLHKCASSYLQEVIFPGVEDVAYLKLGWDPGTRASLLDIVRFREPFDPEHFRKQVAGLAGWDERGERALILSHEGMSGSPDGSGAWDAAGVGRRLKEAFPEAYILVVVRSQYDYAQSLYAYRVCVNGLETRSFRRYLHEQASRGLVEKLLYDKLLQEYRDLFSPERVLMLPVELLKKDEDRFLLLLARFAGFDICPGTREATRRVNASTRSRRSLLICRGLNALITPPCRMLEALGFTDAEAWLRRNFMHAKSRRLLPLLHRFPGKKNLGNDPQIRSFFLGCFTVSNKKLSQETGMQFGDFGYHQP